MFTGFEWLLKTAKNVKSFMEAEYSQNFIL